MWNYFIAAEFLSQHLPQHFFKGMRSICSAVLSYLYTCAKGVGREKRNAVIVFYKIGMREIVYS